MKYQGINNNNYYYYYKVACFNHSQQRRLVPWVSHLSLSFRSWAARSRPFQETTESPSFFSSAFRSLFSALTPSCSTTASLATRS